MRLTLVTTVVLASGCLSTASQTEFQSTGAVTVNAPFKPLQNPDPVKPLSGTGPVSCAATDGGTRFIDATDAWNLGATGLKLTGNRLTVADLDGDGYPDLVVHAVSSNARQSLDGGKRLVWQLMNRPTPDGQFRTFVDESGNGLFEVLGGSTTQYRSAQLAVFGDVDNDGDLDAFSGTYTDPNRPDTDPGDRSEIMLNDGTGHFTMATESATTPLPTELMPTTSAAFTDADRDGRLDVFVGNWYEAYGYSYLGVQARLFHGQGDGQFTDVTATANLTTDNTGFGTFTNHRPAYGVTACDVDDDGAPELMVSAYGRQPNLLYRNDGAGRFVDQSVASGFASDGNADYRDNENFRCWCTVNRSNANCQGVSNPSIGCPNPASASWGVGTDDQPWRNGGNTFTTWCGDVDGDGKNELYNAEIHHWWAGGASDSSELLKNVSTAGSARFTRPGNAATGLRFPHPSTDWNEGGLMAAGGDLDNDGRLDLIAAASDYADQFGLIFQQQADGTFNEQGLAWGLRHECMSGLAVADFDRDGDLDVLAGASTARDCARKWRTNEVRLYENVAVDSKWLLLHLEGDGSTTNRAAIGAKVTVKAGGRTVTREVSGGYGHFGMQNDLTVHVGLGGCEGADEVTVRWPDARGTTQVFDRLPGNQFMRLKQGAPEAFQVR
ncbi:MAG: CRTAC1 family protein [Archangium sp.]|nr:CRTAC1 family protein [Archangium sp.]